jgi:hypothetical protein
MKVFIVLIIVLCFTALTLAEDIEIINRVRLAFVYLTEYSHLKHT